MLFSATPIADCVVVDIEAHTDDRGAFARTWCQREFVDAGLPGNLVQCSLSRNIRRGTLRGMHYQKPPSKEGKLVRCSRGSIQDIIVDLRPESPSFLRHFSVDLTEENQRGLFIAPGCAHGFLTLSDDTDVFYQMTDHYMPEVAAGFRWDDPLTGIEWPDIELILNERDRNYPDLILDELRAVDWSDTRAD